jgi:hypothetical protein
MFLPLNPINQRLQPANNIKITLPRRVPKLELFHLTLLIQFRVLVLDLFVGHVLTNAGVELVQDSELDFGLVVNFDELGGLDGSLES